MIKGYNFDLLNEVINLENIIKPLKWNEIFDNNNSLIVEVGCGNGHFLVKKGGENPDKNFIGIDIKEKRLIRCREKQEKYGVKNVKWVCAEAFNALNEVFDDKSISLIYMLFPDPWPKRRHHKHRLLNKEFLDLIFNKLIDSGTFVYFTDFKEYYDSSCKLVLNDNRFEVFSEKNLDFDELTGSFFGEKWKNDNRNFYGFLIKKKAKE
jgi:tRNA (guanine-N7-)-methyltransferase